MAIIAPMISGDIFDSKIIPITIHLKSIIIQKFHSLAKHGVFIYFARTISVESKNS